MLHNSKANSLEPFQFSHDDFNEDILITCCPKTVFSVHPDPNRVMESVLVNYHNNRWHLVDTQLYRNGVYIAGLLRADLYACVDSDGNSFLLISTYPLSGEMTTWRESVLDVVDAAREDWVKMSKTGNGYQAQVINSIRYAPRWSKIIIDEFVLEAFGGNVMTAINGSVSVLAYQQVARNSRHPREVVLNDF